LLFEFFECIDRIIDVLEGIMNARKYKGITRALKAIATRDLQNLVKLHILNPMGGRRSTRYEILFINKKAFNFH
jgi:Fic family protein